MQLPPTCSPALSQNIDRRATQEILAVLDAPSPSSRTRKKALVKASLGLPPVRSAIDILKSSAVCRRALNSCLPSWVKFQGVYSSFAEANLHAPKNIPLGYDHDAIALGYKDQHFLASDYPAAMWLGEILSAASTVFDLGGSVGTQFYLFENYVRYPQGFRWTVCELPAVARAGQQIANERREDRLHFTTQFEEADGCGCLLASGSLQYIDSSLADLLNVLKSPPEHLIINRIPLHKTRSCVTVQNIRWMVSPYRIFARDSLLRDLESVGYKLVDAWAVPDHSCWIPFYPEFSVESYSGLYLRRNR